MQDHYVRDPGNLWGHRHSTFLVHAFMNKLKRFGPIVNFLNSDEGMHGSKARREGAAQKSKVLQLGSVSLAIFNLSFP